MIPVLLSIPGKLKTLIDRITLARMQKIDEITPERMSRLDAAMTSRAAASTALSTATWTNLRADNLDQIASSRMTKIDKIFTTTQSTLGNDELMTLLSNPSISSADLESFLTTGDSVSRVIMFAAACSSCSPKIRNFYNRGVINGSPTALANYLYWWGDLVRDGRIAKIDALDARLTSARATLLDKLGTGVPALRVQRGVFASAGSVTITAVNTSKSFIISVSKGSAGYVAARGTISLTPSGGDITMPANSSGVTYVRDGSFPSYSGAITGGTTDLTTKAYSAVLTNSTTITADGPCEWQVIEGY